MLDYGMFFGMKQSEMALENINSISYQTGLILGSIEIWHGGARMLIENCGKKTVKPFCDAVNKAIKELKNEAAPAQTAAPPEKSTGDDDICRQTRTPCSLKRKRHFNGRRICHAKS